MFCFLNLNVTFHHYFSSLKKTRPFLSWETNLCRSQEKHQNISKTSQNPIPENPSKNIRKKNNKNIKLPAPSIGWCLNRKGLLHGTFCYPFGTPWRVQVHHPKKPRHIQTPQKISPLSRHQKIEPHQRTRQKVDPQWGGSRAAESIVDNFSKEISVSDSWKTKHILKQISHKNT